MPIKYPKETAADITDKLISWMEQQKYGNEPLLHAAVSCDFVGSIRFKAALQKIITDNLEKAQ